MSDQGALPISPPPLQEHVTISRGKKEQADTVLAELSARLESLPVVLSQDGEAVGFAGGIDPTFANRIARVIERVWQDGAMRIAREFIRFEEEILEDSAGRSSYVLYSTHVVGAVTLTVGWQLSLPVTQLRSAMLEGAVELNQFLT
jgi:hypothetical protein